MADSKVADLTEDTAPATTDLVYVVHDPAGTPVDRKVTVGNVRVSRWAQRLNDPATSLANFTSVSGTWASSGGVITQSDTSVGYKNLRTASALRGNGRIFEAKIRFPTTGQATTGTIYAALVSAFDGTTANLINAPMVRLSRPYNSTAGTLELIEAGGVPASTAVTVALDTFYTVRLVQVGLFMVAYVDGTEKLGAAVRPTTMPDDYAALASYGSKADFDDIKLWTDTNDLPA